MRAVDCFARVLYKATQSDPSMRVCLLCESLEQCSEFDRTLWTFNPEAFLPHGCVGEPYAEQHPVYVTTSLDSVPNNADTLVFTNLAAVNSWTRFERYIYGTTDSLENVQSQLPRDKPSRIFIERDKRWECVKG